MALTCMIECFMMTAVWTHMLIFFKINKITVTKFKNWLIDLCWQQVLEGIWTVTCTFQYRPWNRKISDIIFNLFMYVMKTLGYCTTDVFALNKFSSRKVLFLSLEQNEVIRATTFFYFRKFCTIVALCDDPLSRSNLTLAKLIAGLRFWKHLFRFGELSL
jgi:hypothetical protein